MNDIIKNSLKNSLETHRKLLQDDQIHDNIIFITRLCLDAFESDNKLLLCGNGGSASDAQHIASELSGRFYKDRSPLNAQALHVNTSYMTAVANDYGFSKTYERSVQAFGKKGDILIGISTSGNSSNVINAIKIAKEKKLVTVGFTGIDGGKLNDICDHIIKIPSNDTARIQEGHILIGHIMCELIEKSLFS
tara:strand:+ start:780 stop:1355 length:576 start_codon:yes stop_codon:yes gene_type:complete